jgi:hypothetical protein
MNARMFFVTVAGPRRSAMTSAGRSVALALLLTTLAMPVVAAAQPARVYKVGYLDLNSPAVSISRFEAFRQGLRELGWVEGKSITFEYRSAPGKSNEVFTALAEELAQLGVDVILTMSNKGVAAAKRGAPRVPIVMVFTRSRRHRPHRKSCASGRNHHGAHLGCGSRHRREAVSASRRTSAWTLPRDQPLGPPRPGVRSLLAGSQASG